MKAIYEEAQYLPKTRREELLKDYGLNNVKVTSFDSHSLLSSYH
jgi:hypothetical protein